MEPLNPNFADGNQTENAMYSVQYTNNKISDTPLKIIKHGGGNIMVCDEFSWHGIGPIVRNSSRMDQHLHKLIIGTTIRGGSFTINMPVHARQ